MNQAKGFTSDKADALAGAKRCQARPGALKPLANPLANNTLQPLQQQRKLECMVQLAHL